MRKPWFRKSDGWWYLTVNDGRDRRHERLSQDKKEAFDKWHAREATPDIGSRDVEIITICESFLEWSEANSQPATYQYHLLYLESFCRSCGTVAVRSLKHHHVTDWLKRARFKGKAKNLTDGARRAAITCAKRALNWAVAQGYIAANPIAKYQRPASGRREQVVDREELRAVRGAVDGPFRLLLLALHSTGCRPREVRMVEARHVDLAAEVWQGVPNKTKKQTGLDRTVYIGSPCLNTITRILMHYRPSGPLFRNRDGEPWTENAVRCRMRRLRADYKDTYERKTDRRLKDRPRLPAKTVAYSFRHTYITESLMAGVDAATVAALTGTSIEMIERHYGHLTQRGDHLRRAAKRASSARDAAGPSANESGDHSS